MKMNRRNRFFEEHPGMGSLREMAERFRKPEWLRQINEANALLSKISQVQSIWAQSEFALEYSTTTTRISEAIRPLLDTQHRLNCILGNQQLMKNINGATRSQKYLLANSGLIQTVQEATAWYNDKAPLFHGIEMLTLLISDTTLKAVANAQSNFANMVQGYNFSSLRYEEDTLIYDGREYTIDELDTELNNEIDIVEKHKTIPEKFEETKKKLWLLFLLIYIISAIPDVVEKANWYAEKIQTAISILDIQDETPTDIFAYITKDSAILRKSASPKSPQVSCLPYDTKLRVISDTPRWFEVEYIDNEGNSIIGWISKIGVTTEDSL